MKIKFKDIDVFYKTIGESGEWLVFLHGWRGSIESFELVAKNFKNNRCLLIDFPPFGNSEEPYEIWDIDTYTDLVFNILEAEKIKSFSFIAHSFGGRVAINFSSVYNERVKKLLLVDSAGIRPRFSVKKFIAVSRYRIAKKLGKNTDSFGSPDYKALSPLMRKTFVNIVNQNALPSLKNITAKTLIINGEHDDQTPLYMAKKLHKHIKNSALIIFENCGHFAYLEDYLKFIAVSKSFFKE